ncbi:hypothetical protein L873DRAFT_371146 [Choiromyces venosus 120613-1]|uniref:Uncharacterized protein n=1 Tax=Choiromyces venosus 120613-1 TaxID=1336337 RepID=A0A3N4J114_9PEZI|nr:hypothetical protein L873DRAFT_371146 [Choiromyces venosus 120613-1]
MDTVGSQMLLEQCDINPNIPDTLFGQTPLCCATRSGHSGVAMLLERGDINLKIPDKSGSTPLSVANSGGYHNIANLLPTKQRESIPEPPNSQEPAELSSAESLESHKPLTDQEIPTLSDSPSPIPTSYPILPSNHPQSPQLLIVNAPPLRHLYLLSHPLFHPLSISWLITTAHQRPAPTRRYRNP